MYQEHITKIIEEAVKIARTNRDADTGILYRCIYDFIELSIIHLCQQNIMSAGKIGIGFPDNSIKIKIWIMTRYCGYFSTVFDSTANLTNDEPIVVNKEAVKEPEYEPR